MNDLPNTMYHMFSDKNRTIHIEGPNKGWVIRFEPEEELSGNNKIGALLALLDDATLCQEVLFSVEAVREYDQQEKETEKVRVAKVPRSTNKKLPPG